MTNFCHRSTRSLAYRPAGLFAIAALLASASAHATSDAGLPLLDALAAPRAAAAPRAPHSATSEGLPPGGVDVLPARMNFDFAVGPGLLKVSVEGNAIIERQDPQIDPLTNRPMIEVEILSLSLSGFDPGSGAPIRVTGGSDFGLPSSPGTIEPLFTDQNFPVESFFDIYIRIELGPPFGAVLENHAPLRLSGADAVVPLQGPLLQESLVPGGGCGQAPVALYDLATSALAAALSHGSLSFAPGGCNDTCSGNGLLELGSTAVSCDALGAGAEKGLKEACDKAANDDKGSKPALQESAKKAADAQCALRAGTADCKCEGGDFKFVPPQRQKNGPPCVIVCGWSYGTVTKGTCKLP